MAKSHSTAKRAKHITGGILANLDKARSRPAPLPVQTYLPRPSAARIVKQLSALGRQAPALPSILGQLDKAVALLAGLRLVLSPNGDTPWRLVLERRTSRRMRERQHADQNRAFFHDVQQRAAELRAKGQRSPKKQAITAVATLSGAAPGLSGSNLAKCGLRAYRRDRRVHGFSAPLGLSSL